MSTILSSNPKEFELLDPVQSFFGTRHYTFAHEVPLGQRKIDLLAIDKRTHRWISIELKVRDWKNALRQATLNHLVADQSYVALWHRAIPAALRKQEIFGHYQVGIISVGSTHCEVLLDFSDNPHDPKRHMQRDRAIKRIASRSVVEANKIEPAAILSA
jgi:hypothetical protein